MHGKTEPICKESMKVELTIESCQNNFSMKITNSWVIIN